MEDVFIMVMVIVAVCCAAGVANNYMKMKRETGHRVEGEDRDAIEAELDELRGRVEVLEKIVTDEKFQLHREINNLERRA